MDPDESTPSLIEISMITEEILGNIESSITNSAQILLSANVKECSSVQERDTAIRMKDAFPNLSPICKNALVSPTLSYADVETLHSLAPMFIKEVLAISGEVQKHMLTLAEEKRLRRRMRHSFSDLSATRKPSIGEGSESGQGKSNALSNDQESEGPKCEPSSIETSSFSNSTDLNNRNEEDAFPIASNASVTDNALPLPARATSLADHSSPSQSLFPPLSLQ